MVDTIFSSGAASSISELTGTLAPIMPCAVHNACKNWVRLSALIAAKYVTSNSLRRRCNRSSGKFLYTTTCCFICSLFAVLCGKRCIQLRACGQAFHVTDDLDGERADTVAAHHGLLDAQSFQQGTDHADGKTVTGADRVDHFFYGHAGDDAFFIGIAKIGALGSQLDDDLLDALLQIKGGDIVRCAIAGQNFSFA